jgi:hypothetical protein
MLNREIVDDGFRIVEIGEFRWRVHPTHEAEVVRAIRRRWRRESTVR